MRRSLVLVMLLFLVGPCPNGTSAGNEDPVPPPQDQGLPYTRSARAKALALIRQGIAVFPGSRYGYYHGYRVRLDESDLRHGEAILKDGKVLVPAGFAATLRNPNLRPDTSPEYLADRWVYTLGVPAIKEVPVDLAASAAAAHLPVARDTSGMLVIGINGFDFANLGAAQRDSLITLFDTPEEFADPDIATKYIPRLARQGNWTDHVKTTPEQLALLDGPRTNYDLTPLTKFDYTGFDQNLLGSTVPAPGIYPRLLFSEADIPMFLKRIQSQKLGQKTLIQWEELFSKTWWDEKTSDGQVFAKLASDTEYKTLRWPEHDISPGAGVTHSLFEGQKPGIQNSHVNYNTNCLTSMALYCLLTGNKKRGRQAATAICNYYRLIEPFIDTLNATSDSEFGTTDELAGFGETSWRGMHAVVAHMDLGCALDFGGKWMTAEQKEHMRRIIAKATYGRVDNMQAAPMRVRDINHMTWHLTNFLAVSAIEGLEGADPEVLEIGRESAYAFCEWGIDQCGQMFESNGKSGGGIQFQILAMNVLARRGLNLWGHPHWRALSEAQMQATSPNGGATVSSGTWGGSPFSIPAMEMFHAFYPGDRPASCLLTTHVTDFNPVSFDPASYRTQFDKVVGRTRLPGPTYPGFTFNGIYDTDWAPVSRADVHMPQTFVDPVHGLLSAYSDDTQEATWLYLHARSNQYIGSGHHHADVGMFYFSSGGVDWITESPFPKEYAGKYHNEVLIDGISEPDTLPARGRWLGAATEPSGAFAAIDQTRSYSYKWMNQMVDWDGDKYRADHPGPNGVTSWHPDPVLDGWTLETDDSLPLEVYRGTQRNKSRPWWPTYNYSNWLPVLRAPFNSVEYAFRTAGLLRGRNPYGLVVDDLKKDASSHLYQWSVMLASGVWQAKVTGLAPNQFALAFRAPDPKADRSMMKPAIEPKPGEPLLLICALGLESQGESPLIQAETLAGPRDSKGVSEDYDRLIINHRAVAAQYRVLLFPFHQGEPLPAIHFDPATGTAKLTDRAEEDELYFTTGSDQRTRIEIRRHGETIVPALN